jgi:hypothetical protein
MNTINTDKVVKHKKLTIANISLIIVVLIILASVAKNGGNKSVNTNTPAAQQTSVVQPTTISAISPTPLPSPETLEGKLTAIAQKTVDKKAKAEYVKDEKLAMGTISDKDYTFWDETDMVNKAWAYFVKFGKEASQLDEPSDIGFAIKTTLVDGYGKESEGNAIAIYMKKSEFAKFNWDTLKGLDITERLKQSSDYFIQPSIWKKVKQDKLKLTF